MTEMTDKHKRVLEIISDSKALNAMGAVNTISGKQYINAVGLNYIAAAYRINVTVEIDHAMSNPDKNRYVVVASARDPDGNISVDVGDASPDNVGKQIRGHELRMASTRARNRVIRNMIADKLPFVPNGIQWTSYEEINSDEAPTGNDGGDKPVIERITKYE